MADTAPSQPVMGQTETSNRGRSRYEVIEATLMRSQEGRAFLAEYARRNRAADTEMLLEAIARLEHIIRRPQNDRDNEGVWGELVEMSEAIARMRREIAAIKPPSQIIAATRTAIAALVAMVLSHGCQPARISVNGSRNRHMNT